MRGGRGGRRERRERGGEGKGGRGGRRERRERGGEGREGRGETGEEKRVCISNNSCRGVCMYCRPTFGGKVQLCLSSNESGIEV